MYTYWPVSPFLASGGLLPAAHGTHTTDARHQLFHRRPTASRLKSRKSFMRTVTPLDSFASSSTLRIWKDRRASLRQKGTGSVGELITDCAQACMADDLATVTERAMTCTRKWENIMRRTRQKKKLTCSMGDSIWDRRILAYTGYGTVSVFARRGKLCALKFEKKAVT